MKLSRIRVGKGVVAVAITTFCLWGAEFVQSWVRHGQVMTGDAVSLAILAVMTLFLIFFRAKDKTDKRQAGGPGAGDKK
jgi:hypothetical protein